MAGDKVQISTYAFYNTAVQPPPGGVDLTSEILSLLSTGVVNNSAGKITSAASVSTAVNPGVTNFLTNNRPYDNAKPKAYLNWILFDNQFNYIASNSGVQQAVAGASKQALIAPLQTIAKNGYLYIYLSNESQQDVYFDDLNVKHYTGPLVQEQSYYPFGLQMAGISDKALNKLSSQNKFNGGVELEEEYGVNLYSTFFRQYDPQLGRFSGVDLLAEQSIGVSTYQFALNNPIYFNDPLGLKQELPRYIGDGKYMFKNGTVVGWSQVEDILASDYGNEMTSIWNAGDANGGGGSGGYITSFGFGTNKSGVEGFRIIFSFAYQNTTVERHIGMGNLFVSFGKFDGYQNKWVNAGDKFNDAFGGAQAAMMFTISLIPKEQIIKTAGNGTIDLIQQVSGVGVSGNKLIKAINGIGVVGGYIDAGVAIYDAIQNPTAGNITKAVLKGVLAIVKTNPVVGIITSVLDISGATDWLFRW
jgi:RHS repeat-associated protein